MVPPPQPHPRRQCQSYLSGGNSFFCNFFILYDFNKKNENATKMVLK